LRIIGGTFYRVHKVRYFTRQADQFYKNFIDTQAKFERTLRKIKGQLKPGLDHYAPGLVHVTPLPVL